MIYNMRLLREVARGVYELCERQAVNQRPLSALNLDAIVERVITDNGGSIATDSAFEDLVREAVDAGGIAQTDLTRQGGWLERAQTALAEQVFETGATSHALRAQEDGVAREYFVYSRCAYAGTEPRENGITEEVTLSNGAHAELTLRWYAPGRDGPPSLQLGGVSWQLLSDWSDLLLALSELAKRPVSLEEVEVLLREHDFVDITPSAHS